MTSALVISALIEAVVSVLIQAGTVAEPVVTVGAGAALTVPPVPDAAAPVPAIALTKLRPAAIDGTGAAAAKTSPITPNWPAVPHGSNRPSALSSRVVLVFEFVVRWICEFVVI